MDRLPEETQLRRVSVRGVVQGVGFRPFVYRLAREQGLRGFVLNTSSSVEIEVEGDAASVQRFTARLTTEAPPLARIEEVAVAAGTPNGYTAFEIRDSREDAGYQLISPDIATCPDCTREILDPADRRYRYPFTNCTNCGPRFTIISDIPYDRRNTTMAVFTMCETCRAEYHDPLDRRFHAQPNACPVCGPRVWLEDARGASVACEEVISEAARLIRAGCVLAIKGLGGFLLACDATNSVAVGRLRERKGRPHKPFAVMFEGLQRVREECSLDEGEALLLASPQAPIVLVRRRQGSCIATEVAPSNRYLGVMLPYTPIHHLLLADAGRPLVMTSGNLTEEPIAKDNEEAKLRLQGLADYFLLHNRDIHSRYDDSVALVLEGRPYVVRRGRSYAPYPVRLPTRTAPLLAVGAQEKSAFCLTRDEYAFVSQHIGDLENLDTLEHFAATVELYKRLFRIEPEVVAHDLHPDYLSTRYAQELAGGVPLIGVQHHHAHIVSCMAENGVTLPVIGIALDGSGYGPDGTVWGGEFMVVGPDGCERACRLEPLPLPGGELGIRKPYRLAIAYLHRLLGRVPELPFLEGVSPDERRVVVEQVDKGINTPLTSSCGRLFDAVSALLGIRGAITFEGQAAIELEMRSRQDGAAAPYPFRIEQNQGLWEVRVAPIFEAILDDLMSGVPVREIGLRFHQTIAQVIRDGAITIRDEAGLTMVALSGGCFQNRLLLTRAIPLLRQSGFEVLLHRQVPCNDGGIALGQAVIAAATLR